jgi:phosphatidylglycerol:prolipoprotein diacylglycerol transferase
MIKLLHEGILIFGFLIRYYSILIVIGSFAATFLATRECKRRELDPFMIWEALPWALVAGLIGARIWHVLTPSASILVDGKNPYFLNPLLIINFRHGGLGIPGAILGGALAVWIYTRRTKKSFAKFADVSVAGIALAQAIGRWGNFINQELYGLPTNARFFPLAIYIDPNHRLPGYSMNAYFLPVFFYESIWDLLNMCLLLWLPRKLGEKMKPGDKLLVYTLFYSIGRFCLEFIRLEYSPIAGVNFNQVFMAVLTVGSAIALIVRHASRKSRNSIKTEP